jgi:IclR family pca regulon transcriptional regulator
MEHEARDDRGKDPDFMESLARGLRVLRCFADRERPMTIAAAAEATGLSRSAVRRCLHTLVQLGYATQRDLAYVLQPKVLSLGHAYLSSSTLPVRAQPLLDQLRDEVNESCSLGIQDDDALVYVARAETSRIMSISLRVGSRLPLYATSMGRVLLAGRPRTEQKAYLHRCPLPALTDRTVTDPAALLELLEQVAEAGFAIVDQELEIGLRSVAVPVTLGGSVVAAINIGTQAERVPVTELRTRHVPALRRAARELSIWMQSS